MRTRSLDVAFLVHDAGRTGAPIVLLRLLRELMHRGAVKPRFVIRRAGDLVTQFESLGPVLLLGEPRGLGLAGAGITAQRLTLLANYPRTLALRRFLHGIDILYSNTAVNGDVLRLVALKGVPVVTHVHELSRFLGTWTSPQALECTVARTNTWIAVSTAVADMLVDDWGLASESVSLVRECIDRGVLDHTESRASGNELLGVADDDWVVGCAGTIDSRKGADLFPALARLILNASADRRLVFRWMGGKIGTREHDFAQDEVRRAGLADKVRFVGAIAEPMDAIGRFDVHVLLSREDAYPLVMLEAAARGRPTVCFAGSGGAPEFVSRGAGRVVSYLDLEAMAACVLECLSEPRPESGAQCRSLAAEHDAANAALQIQQILLESVRRVV